MYGQRALYVATPEGLAWAGLPQVDPARVSVADDQALAAVHAGWPCSSSARSASRCGASHAYAPRSDANQAIASAQLGTLRDGRPRLRRPDLVLFPDAALPIALEVELSVKGGCRLEAVCRAWARWRLVSEVRYYAPAHVARAVSRAVSSVPANDAIRILSLEDALTEADVVRLAA